MKNCGNCYEVKKKTGRACFGGQGRPHWRRDMLKIWKGYGKVRQLKSWGQAL